MIAATFGRDGARRRPQTKTHRAPLHASLPIKKTLGEPTSRETRGRHAPEGAQTNVSTVSAGVVHRNPTKVF